MNRIPPLKPWVIRPVPVLPTVYDDSLSYGEQLNRMAKTVNDVVDFCNHFDKDIQVYVNNWLDEHPEATTTVEDGSLTLQKFTDELQKETFNYYVTPEMFGAIGNGVVDDTEAVQNALNTGGVVILTGTYLVNSSSEEWHIALTVKSNTYIIGNGTIKLNPNNYKNYSIMRIYGCDNVIIDGISVIGDGIYHTGDSGEWGYGIDIDNSKNVIIKNVKVSDCWGDGIIVNHLDDTKPFTEINENISILNSKVKHCGRNCITVSHGKYINIYGCDISDAYRTAPRDLIDIEPDLYETVRYVTVTNCKLHNNARGIEVVVAVTPSYLSSEYITIDNNMFDSIDYPINVNGIGAISGNYLNITNNILSDCKSAVISVDANYNFINNICSLNNTGTNVLNTSYSGSIIKNNVFIGGSTGSMFILDGASDFFEDNVINYAQGTALIEIAEEGAIVKRNTQSGAFTGDVFKITSGSLYSSHNALGYIQSPKVYDITDGTVLSFFNVYYGASYSGEDEVTTKYDIINNTVVE